MRICARRRLKAVETLKLKWDRDFQRSFATEKRRGVGGGVVSLLYLLLFGSCRTVVVKKYFLVLMLVVCLACQIHS